MKHEQLEYASLRYRTPLYIFDTDILREEVKRFRKNLGKEIGICYAMKANAFLTEQMSEMTDRIEICSMGEFKICRELKIPYEKMLISGVMKRKEDIWKILDCCRGRCIYTVESLNQFYCFVDWCDAHNEVIYVYLRLTSGNQFGMDEQTIRSIISVSDICPFLKIIGIHYFSGTQKKSMKLIEKELNDLDMFLNRLKEESQFEVECLEYGPGIAVPYFSGKETEVFQDTSIQRIRELIAGMKWKGLVTLEMGRALTAMCGYYMTEIRDLKQTGGINYCIVDGGSHQMNYDGQIKGMYHPIIQTIPKRMGGKERKWTVCGALCTVNDILCKDIKLKNINMGDIMVFERTGAYSATEGMALFLSHDLPKVVLYSEKMGWKLVRDKQPVYRWNMSREVEDGYIDDDFK
ncbi:decarboxylase [Faecalimonas umbilicata]|nr:decarboxylase [Faecalimonas umbilicata]